MNLAESLQSFIDRVPEEDLGLGPRGQDLGSLVFSRPFLAMHQLAKLYTLAQCLGLLRDLGCGPALERGATLEELLPGFHPQSRRALAWMLDFLALEGVLDLSEGCFRLPRDPEIDLSELRALADREAPGHEPTFDLLDAVRRQIRPYFTEGRSGDQLLFDLSIFPLWLGYFRNENLIYRCNNVFTLAALQEGLRPGTRVLELGGGAASFAQLLAQDGARHGYLDRFSDYRFTDVAPTFLRRAQRNLSDWAPGIPFSFSLADIDRPLVEQGLEGAAFDVILGVNVLHVAKDLPQTLALLRRHLAPGGRLIVGECLKPRLGEPIYVEWFFQFVTSFCEVATDPELRPAPGFLTPEVWVKLLRHAGFAEVREVPRARPLMDSCSAFYVGAFEARG